MKDNKLQIVNFEQAQRLKAAGFGWTHKESGCKWYYVEPNGNVMTMDLPFTDKSIAAPAVALALKWMRDVHNLFGDARIGNEPRGLFFFDVWNKNGEFLRGGNLDYNTYETAESALLDELLNVLDKLDKISKA